MASTGESSDCGMASTTAAGDGELVSNVHAVADRTTAAMSAGKPRPIQKKVINGWGWGNCVVKRGPSDPDQTVPTTTVRSADTVPSAPTTSVAGSVHHLILPNPQRTWKISFPNKSEPLKTPFTPLTLSSDFFGSEGWGFECLRARHEIHARGPMMSPRLLSTIRSQKCCRRLSWD